MTKITHPNDLAYNACVDAVGAAQTRLMGALDDYNRAVKAAETLHPLDQYVTIRLETQKVKH